MLKYRNNQDLYQALGRKSNNAVTSNPVEASVEEAKQEEEVQPTALPENQAVVVESYPIAKDFEAVLNKL